MFAYVQILLVEIYVMPGWLSVMLNIMFRMCLVTNRNMTSLNVQSAFIVFCPFLALTSVVSIVVIVRKRYG